MSNHFLETQEKPFILRRIQTWDEISYKILSQSSDPEGRIWLSVGRMEGSYLIRFPYLADFIYEPDSRNVTCLSVREIPEKTLQHLYRNQVAPMLAAHQGCTVLHASAVVLPQSPPAAVAFLGESGMGKSTLTTSFCQAGLPLLADDCLMVELEDGVLTGFPSLPELRLWMDSAQELYPPQTVFTRAAHYTTKLWMDAAQANFSTASTPVPLRALYILVEPLEDDPRITITPLSGHAAFLSIFKQTFHLDPTDQSRLRAEFHIISRIAGLPIFYRLSYPRDFARLPDVRQAILTHIQSLSAA